MQNKMNRFRKVLISSGLICCVMFGCLPIYGNSKAKGPGKVRLATPFNLKQGQEVWLQGTSLRIKLVDVQDSRCPKNVTCVWAGNGAVKLDVSVSGRHKKTLTVNTSKLPALPGDQTYFGYRISLVALNPYPGTSDGGKPVVRVTTLTVTRLRK